MNEIIKNVSKHNSSKNTSKNLDISENQHIFANELKYKPDEIRF